MKLLITAFLCLALCGCATQQFNFKSNQGRLSEDKMQLFFVSGIGQKQEIQPSSICGSMSRVARVEVEQTALDIVLGVLTFGIFTPRHARVYCQ